MGSLWKHTDGSITIWAGRGVEDWDIHAYVLRKGGSETRPFFSCNMSNCRDAGPYAMHGMVLKYSRLRSHDESKMRPNF